MAHQKKYTGHIKQAITHCLNVSKGQTMTTSIQTPTHATINTEVGTVMRGWSSDTIKADMTKTKRTDVLRAAGWTSAHCVSPKSEGSAATEQSWTFAKSQINSGFPKTAQALMELSAKAAGDKTVNGQPRAYWMRQANAVIADIKKQLQHREDIAADVAAGKTGPDARTVTPETKVRELLNDAIKRVQKAEAFECSIELDDLIQGLGNLAKTIG